MVVGNLIGILCGKLYWNSFWAHPNLFYNNLRIILIHDITFKEITHEVATQYYVAFLEQTFIKSKCNSDFIISVLKILTIQCLGALVLWVQIFPSRMYSAYHLLRILIEFFSMLPIHELSNSELCTQYRMCLLKNIILESPDYFTFKSGLENTNLLQFFQSFHSLSWTSWWTQTACENEENRPMKSIHGSQF